jgi:hypothetical protein
LQKANNISAFRKKMRDTILDCDKTPKEGE